MPNCDECGHIHLAICGCGCSLESCKKCEHQHGDKKKDGSCQWCGCTYVEKKKAAKSAPRQ